MKINPRDIYIKTTTAKGSSISYHRVWDAEQFLAKQQEQARRDSEKDPANAYTISLAAGPKG